MWSLLLAGAAGAALAYFLDPDSGARRRNVTRDRLAAAVRRGTRRGGQLSRFAAGHAEGLAYRAAHPEPANPRPSDLTLVDRVESEVFRARDAEKGRVNVNAVDGVVFLRGQLERPDEIKDLEARVRAVPGVKDVRNLLHLPNTPAPTVG